MRAFSLLYDIYSQLFLVTKHDSNNELENYICAR